MDLNQTDTVRLDAFLAAFCGNDEHLMRAVRAVVVDGAPLRRTAREQAVSPSRLSRRAAEFRRAYGEYHTKTLAPVTHRPANRPCRMAVG